MSVTKGSEKISIPLKNPTKTMTSIYILSLSIIAVLSIVVHLVLDRITHEQIDSAKIVNLSGQQRMLSQRISLFTMEYLSTGHQDSKKQAQQALESLNNNHNLLIDQYMISEEIYDLFFSPPHDVDKQIRKFTQLINQRLNSDLTNIRAKISEVNFQFFEMSKNPLLASLDRVVHQYEDESVKSISELKNAQQVVSIIILLTLLIEALFIFRPMVNKVKEFAENLQKEASYDHLSGLLNRRSFTILIDKALALSKRYNYDLSLLSFDIDYFKSINDTYGHDTGDKAIRHISDIIKDNIRLSDSVARFGGEEFVVLLPHTKLKDAFTLAERIRKSIEQTPLSLDNLIIEITASIGVSEFTSQDTTVDDILKRADTGLYKAKKTGRNRVCNG